MIRTKDLVPSIYYDKSRDFQAIGRVFEVVYNYAKTNTDLILNSYEDIKMLDLLAKTIGFNSKHNYNTEDLYTLCNTFITILKQKGSIVSVELAVIAMLNAQHLVNEKYYIDDHRDEETNKKDHRLDIYIPQDLEDRILLDDLFDYILPAGYAYRFIDAAFPEKHQYTDISAVSDYTPFKFSDSNRTSQVAVVEHVEDGHDENITRPAKNESNISDLGITYTGVVFRPKRIGEL